jgi:hypothetical protein
MCAKVHVKINEMRISTKRFKNMNTVINFLFIHMYIHIPQHYTDRIFYIDFYLRIYG